MSSCRFKTWGGREMVQFCEFDISAYGIGNWGAISLNSRLFKKSDPPHPL